MTPAATRQPADLRRALAHLPPDAIRALARYLPPPARRARLDTRVPERQYWALGPGWVAARARRPVSARTLADVEWGQRALFLFVRIHDDVYDGHAASPGLVYAADLLLLESARAFALHAGNRFWSIFGGCLATTLSAIVEADALQRRRGGMPPGSHRIYARVAAIFKVGTAAMLQITGRSHHLPAFSGFADELAIADQIVDDLIDLDEDLGRGRLNYVASTLLRQAGAGPARSGDTAARLARAVDAGGLSAVVRQVRRHLARARRAARPLRLPEIDGYLAPLEERLGAVEAHLHRARVLEALGPLLAPTARRPSSRAPARAR